MLLSKLDKFLDHYILVLGLLPRRQVLQLVLDSFRERRQLLGLCFGLNSLMDVGTHLLLIYYLHNNCGTRLAMLVSVQGRRAGRACKFFKVLLVPVRHSAAFQQSLL